MLMADAAKQRNHVARNTAREYQSSSQAKADRESEKRHRGKLCVGVDIPTRQEIKAIVEALEGRWRPVILTAIFTGLRSSELRGLRWSSVDFAKSELHVRERVDQYAKFGAPKSAAGERVIPLSPIVVNALRELKLSKSKDGISSIAGPNDLLFPNREGGPMGHTALINQGWQAVQIKAGIVAANGEAKYMGMHAAQRIFMPAGLLIRRRTAKLGLSAKAAQVRLGHSSIAMLFDTYGHLFPRGDDAEELAAAERALLDL